MGRGRGDADRIAGARGGAQRARSDQLIDKITHAQQELRESRDEVSAIVDGIASGIIAQRPDGEIVYANDVAARMLDWERRRLDDRLELRARCSSGSFCATKTAARLTMPTCPAVARCAARTNPTALLRYIVKSTGEELWMFVRSTAIFGDDGEPVLAIAVVEDNTERKRNEMSQRFLADASKKLSESLDFDSAVACRRATRPSRRSPTGARSSSPGAAVRSTRSPSRTRSRSRGCRAQVPR